MLKKQIHLIDKSVKWIFYALQTRWASLLVERLKESDQIADFGE
jgi:hypothetical protein